MTVGASIATKISVSSAKLGVIPARYSLGNNLKYDAFWRAGASLGGDTRPLALFLAGRAKGFADLLRVCNDLAVAANQHALQFVVRASAFHHHSYLWIAAYVHDLLRLAVGGHVNGAVDVEIVHRDHVWKSVLIQRGKRGLEVLVQELLLLVTIEFDQGLSVRHRVVPFEGTAPLKRLRQSFHVWSIPATKIEFSHPATRLGS